VDGEANSWGRPSPPGGSEAEGNGAVTLEAKASMSWRLTSITRETIPDAQGGT
jgi:hypothetical protein